MSNGGNSKFCNRGLEEIESSEAIEEGDDEKERKAKRIRRGGSEGGSERETDGANI